LWIREGNRLVVTCRSSNAGRSNSDGDGRKHVEVEQRPCLLWRRLVRKTLVLVWINWCFTTHTRKCCAPWALRLELTFSTTYRDDYSHLVHPSAGMGQVLRYVSRAQEFCNVIINNWRKKGSCFAQETRRCYEYPPVYVLQAFFYWVISSHRLQDMEYFPRGGRTKSLKLSSISSPTKCSRKCGRCFASRMSPL
jgi:hypothetical protein